MQFIPSLVRRFTLLRKILIIFLLGLYFNNAASQQISISRIEVMPDAPEPYFIRDWGKVAQVYDSLIFDTEATGTYLPFIKINENGINYNGETISMATYVGQQPDEIAEAINIIPAIVGASLSGVDKSDQFGKNWVKMIQDFYNSKNNEGIYLNNYSGSSGNDWWYETMPNVFFYQLFDLYPDVEGFDDQFVGVADRWLGSLSHMGGSATPWQVPYMNYRAWNFRTMEPLTSGVKQPGASGAIAWILFHAYQETGDEDYRIGAEWALEFLNDWDSNPNYELQLAYGVLTAAKMNAVIDADYDLDKLLNWAFERGPLRGWGIINGNWGGYDCYGLRGEANDQGNDYAFLMNGFQQASALVPMIRYQEQYANTIAKWVLNLANASRYFYPGFLPEDQQDNSNWAMEHDPYKTVAHESMKEVLNGFSPYATGDAVQGGWAPTNLSLYSSSSVGYLGGIVKQSNVEKILILDLVKTDFFSEAFPTKLMWNPYDIDTTININVGNENVNIYDSRTNEILEQSVSGNIQLHIPAKDSRLLVYLPVGSEIEYNGNKSLVNDVVFDFDNGETTSDVSPRIKALKPFQNPVEIGDSVFVYCTATGDNLNFEWFYNNETLEGGSVLKDKAPMEPGIYEIKVRVSSNLSLSDSAFLNLEVLEKIPFAPEINEIKANPGKIYPGTETELYCDYSEINGDSVSFSWHSTTGSIITDNEYATWSAPAEEGDYSVYCTVEDVDGFNTDSIKIMVRDMDAFYLGDPVLYLTFNSHALDASNFRHNTYSSNIIFGADSSGYQESAAIFNGNSSSVRIENHEILNFTDGLTVAGWFNPNHNASSEGYLVSHGSWENRWKISLNSNALRATLNTSEGITDLDSESQIINERWYHFAFVYTGEDIELYINGSLDNFSPWSGRINETAFDLVLGKARPDQNYHYEGYLDDIYVFDHALTPEHINTIMAKGLTFLTESSDASNNVIIHPNPVSDLLTIEFQEQNEALVKYNLLNLKGQSLQAGILSGNNKDSLFIINTKNLEPGVYILWINNSSFSITRKIIKI